MPRCVMLWAALLFVACCTTTARPALAKPTLKGPLPGVLQFDADTGFATLEGQGHLTLMGKVAVYGEFQFVPGDEFGSLEGAGVAVLAAANGDVLVASVKWLIDAEGNGELEFRWPGEITLTDGTTVESTRRFVELPFGGLKATSSLFSDFTGDLSGVRIEMTGEIVDPDPIDF